MMQTKAGEIVDRREMLKVKCKSLAAEAHIIRQVERRSFGALRDELSWHRRSDVRGAARASYMAYGIIRGKPIDNTERPGSPRTEEFWKAVKTMVNKYGPVDKTVREAMLSGCVN